MRPGVETMCCICGVIDKTQAQDGQGAALVNAMAQKAAHRGPDAAGTFAAAGVNLAHRRLAIIDPEPAANQPFLNGGCALVFNGAIYNYRALRAELAGDGAVFHTDSDTEVLLAAWQKWGHGVTEHLRGMWAFALYDEAKNEVFCSRDRFGIKPFYYRETAESFAFASEIKQFTVLPGWQAVANRARLVDFLLLGLLDHTAETMFEGVLQLPPGHNLVVDLAARTVSISRYYSLAEATREPFEGDYAAAQAAFREVLGAAVDEQLRADVPVGSCLSGGLDSTAIVSLVHQKLTDQPGARQLTVSSCSHDKRTDEQEYIDAVVQELGLESHKVWPEKEALLEALPQIAWMQDEPFPSTSMFAQWCVFEGARDSGAKVMLDGQGADEILAGYNGVYGVYLAGLLRKGRFATCAREWRAFRREGGVSGGILMAYTLMELVPRGMKATLRAWGTKGLWGLVRQPKAYRKTSLRQLYAQPVKTMREYAISLLEATSLPKLLHFEDRDSMAFSVEARVPFLDHRLVELALRLPPEYKLRGGLTKAVMRDALAGVMPEKVRQRRGKLGFETPESIWMKENSAEFTALFEEGLAFLGDLVDKPKARAWCAAQLNGEKTVDHGVWCVISVGAWARVFDCRMGEG